MNTLYTSPVLYQRTATGAIQTWQIFAGAGDRGPDDQTGFLRTVWGQLEGTPQETIDYVTQGKNPGKANATTAVAQAVKEAQAKAKKKIDREGYVEDLARAQAGERDQAGVAPMLAKKVGEVNPKNLVWPADLQIKFDGNRVIGRYRPGQAPVLFSRKQKVITAVPHIAKAWELALEGLAEPMDLDGEGYKHGLTLQQISGFFRSDDPKPGYEELGHFVYDLPSHPGTWEERRKALDELFAFRVFPALLRAGGEMVVLATTAGGEPAVWGVHPLYQVRSTSVASLEQAWSVSDHFATLRFEGGILRQLRGLYEQDRRSGVLAKLKRYLDAEFKIVGVSEGRGKFAGKAVFSCVTDKGVQFDCCAPGTMEDKARYFDEADQIVGKKKLSVRYFTLSEDGAPLQPTPLAVRDYEE